MAPQAPWSPTAHAFAQHQFSHVANFWKQGRSASFRLETLPGGHAVLSLTFHLPSASDVVPPPFQVSPVPAPQRPIPPLFPGGSASKRSPVAQAKTRFRQEQVSCKKRKSYRRAVLHRAAAIALSLPPASENTLRSLATTAVAAAASKAVSCVSPSKSPVKQCLSLPPAEVVSPCSSLPTAPCPNCEKEMEPHHQCDDIPLASSSGMTGSVCDQAKTESVCEQSVNCDELATVATTGQGIVLPAKTNLPSRTPGRILNMKKICEKCKYLVPIRHKCTHD